MSRCTTPLRWAKPSAAATSVGDVGRPVGAERPLGAEDVGEAAPVDVLHDDEVGAAPASPQS